MRKLKKITLNGFKLKLYKMVQKIKNLRIQVDGLSQLTKTLKPVDALFGDPENAPENAAFKHIMINSPEINKAYDCLILAKAWLGKILGEMGEETPYKNDGNRKTVSDIEPAADISSGQGLFKDEMEIIWYTELNHIEKVDWLRQKIEKIYKTIPTHRSFVVQHKSNNALDDIYLFRSLVVQYLCEARFRLGFELGRCRDKK